MTFRERQQPLVPKAPPALLAWLWPDKYTKPHAPQEPPTPSETVITPQPRVDSNRSILSTDSYLAELKPIDDKFRQLCQDILILDTGRTILQERKHLSQEIKKRERLPVLFPWRRKWTPAMDDEYKIYKYKVDTAVPLAKKEADNAKRLVEESARWKESMQLQEMKLCHALDYQRVWFDVAIDAAKARIEFMHKYSSQGCFTPKGDKGHLIAAQNSLNSARNAVRQLEQKREELRKLRVRMDQEARRCGSFYAQQHSSGFHQQQQQQHRAYQQAYGPPSPSPSPSWHGHGYGRENGNGRGHSNWVYRGSHTN